MDLFQDTLNKLIRLKLNLSGYFHAQGEDGEKNRIYQVTDDNLMVEVGSVAVAVS